MTTEFRYVTCHTSQHLYVNKESSSLAVVPDLHNAAQESLLAQGAGTVGKVDDNCIFIMC